MQTPEFKLKWKLFKHHLRSTNKEFDLYMPTNKKEIIQTINLIKCQFETDNHQKNLTPVSSS